MYINMDNIQKHLILKLFLAIFNYKGKNNYQDANTSILTYKNLGLIFF